MTLAYDSVAGIQSRRRTRVAMRIAVAASLLYTASYIAFRMSPWSYAYYSQGSWEIAFGEGAPTATIVFLPPMLIEAKVWNCFAKPPTGA